MRYKTVQHRTKVKNAVKDILWMARRYANHRKTYSPTMFNDAYDILREEFGYEIDPRPVNNERGEPMHDVTIPHTDTHPYAIYGDDLISHSNEELKRRPFYKE